MTQTTRFSPQNEIQLASEQLLDSFFASGYGIEHATEAAQRSQIARWYTPRGTNTRLAVQYIIDVEAGLTNDAFVELRRGKHQFGWSRMSAADVLIYFVVDTEAIYLIRLSSLRLQLPRWERRYSKLSIPQDGYTSVGVLVPLEEFEKCAFQVF